MTNRIASLLALSAWAGFCGVSATRCLHEAGLSAWVFGSTIDGLLDRAEWISLGVSHGTLLGLAAMLAAMAIGCVYAALAVGHLVTAPDRNAEPFAGAVFAALFGFYAALGLSGSPAFALFGAGPLATLFIALGLAALLFDHLIADTGDEDDIAFDRIMRHIEDANRSAIAERERRFGDHSDDSR
ncbi:hypothetical protein LQ948_14020 [Jiella sp. MQZ9-1]|uniref:Uncharacterized protein n=1 Tax=Jiella flava TaxID=2816857 RepID=A0A939FY97_9HYPH|nr:hypothetical protein [Jiella flava]MBO0663750.1 hypothetical protein [Jiella flava]MCD2472323.1 hypothetical protein [Jiella flava]